MVAGAPQLGKLPNMNHCIPSVSVFFFEAPINKPWGYPSGCMLSEKSVFDEAKLGAPEIFRANLMYRITRRRFVLQFS